MFVHSQMKLLSNRNWQTPIEIMPKSYYFLACSLSVLVGIYLDQNYNIPDMKSLLQYGETLVRFVLRS